MGIEDSIGVELKDEDVNRARGEEVGYMKSRGIWKERQLNDVGKLRVRDLLR